MGGRTHDNLLFFSTMALRHWATFPMRSSINNVIKLRNGENVYFRRLADLPQCSYISEPTV